MGLAERQERQLELFTDPFEPRILPAAGWPFWTLNRARPGGGLDQQVYRLHQLDYVLRHVRGDVDTYMSQGFFAKPNRRALHLAWLTHAYVDLDLYKLPVPPSPGAAGIMLRLFCNDEGVPEPSLIVFSGRGVYLKWMWSHPIPRAAAGRAVAVNKALVRRFAAWGADPASVDVSRVLRVVGSTNSKSGERAEIMWQAERNGAPLTYDFEMFGDEVLPYSMDQIRGFRAAAQVRQAEVRILSHERARRRAKHEAEQAQKGSQRAFSREDWSWGVVEDIRALAALRHGGRVPYTDEQGPGAKAGPDLMGFHGACQLAQVIPAAQLWHEIQAWGRIILPSEYVSGGAYQRHCSTLLDRAKQAAAGRTVEWRGRQVSPIYGFSKNTLIEQLQVTSTEMRTLSRLIDGDEKRRRDREATMAARRTAGVQERAAWAAEHSQERERPWESEGISRATWFRRQQAPKA